MPRLDNSCVEVGDYTNFSGELIRLALANEVAIKRFILHKIKCETSVDDIFQEAIMMLSTRREEDLESVSLRYVYGCVHIIIKRYRSEKKEDNILYYISNEESLYDQNLDLYNSKEEDGAEEYTVDELNEVLRVLEPSRYKYGYDIFQLLYIKLLIQDNETFHRVLKVVGAGKKDLNKVYNNIITSKEVMAMLEVLSNCINALEVLEKYVYCSDDIKRLIN